MALRRLRCSLASASFARMLLLASALVATPVPAPAQAAAPDVPGQDALVDISIPEQPMSTALQAFARQVGKQIVFYSKDAQRLRARALHGRFSERDALRRILLGSGLDFIYVNARTIGIGRRDANGRFIFSSGAFGQENEQEQDNEEASRPIVVTGRLLDAELSSEAKHKADRILDVLTSDQASQLPDKNVAETLARIPGVALFRNGETGDGAFVSIRGLDSALSLIQFDGVNAAQVNYYSRGVPLEGITSDNVQEIRIFKSPLPADEGSGVGGAVNIISRTPLRDKRSQFRVDGAVNYSDFSRKPGFDGSFSVTRLFNDRFGINLSAYVRRRFTYNYEIADDFINLAYIDGIPDASGRTIPARELFDLGLVSQANYRSFPSGFFSPAQLFFEDHSYQLQEQMRDTLSLSGTIDWRPAEHTLLTLSGRYSRTRIHGNEWEIAFDEDVGAFALQGDRLVATMTDLELDFNAQLEDSVDSNAILQLRGRTDTGPWTIDWQASYATAQSINPQTDIEFSSNNRFDRGRTPPLTYQPFSFKHAFMPVPNLAIMRDAGFAAGAANLLDNTENVGFRQYEMTQRNDRYAFKADIVYRPQIRLLGGTLDSIAIGGKFERSDRYTFFDYYQSAATRLNVDGSFSGSSPGNALGTPLRAFAPLLNIGEADLAQIGHPLAPLGVRTIPRFGEREWRDWAQRALDSFLAADAPYYSRDFFDGQEDIFAGYLQATFEADRLTVIGGVRFEQYRGAFATPLSFIGQLQLISSESVRLLDLGQPGVALDVVRTHARNREVLPRVTARYQVADNFQVRFGAGISLARPTYSQLGRASTVNIAMDIENDGGGAILPSVQDVAGAVAAGGIKPEQIRNVVFNVRNGNPKLKNTRSFNLDLSVEWYPTRGTSLSLGLFHKYLRNFIFIGAESSDNTLDTAFVETLMAPEAVQLLAPVGGIEALAGDRYNATVSFSQPMNGPGATLIGAEIGVNHRFSWAPGFLRYFGFSGNLTLLRSKAEFVVNRMLNNTDAIVALGHYKPGDKLRRHTSFYRAPEFNGNASFFFDNGRVDANLSASYQAQSFRSVGDFGVDRFTGAYTQLDFFLGYRLPRPLSNIKLFFEVADLTDGGWKAADVQSVGKGYGVYDGASFNGREFRLGLRGRF